MGKKNLAHETDKENNLEAKQARADGVYPIRVAKKKKKHKIMLMLINRIFGIWNNNTWETTEHAEILTGFIMRDPVYKGHKIECRKFHWLWMRDPDY